MIIKSFVRDHFSLIPGLNYQAGCYTTESSFFEYAPDRFALSYGHIEILGSGQGSTNGIVVFAYSDTGSVLPNNHISGHVFYDINSNVECFY